MTLMLITPSVIQGAGVANAKVYVDGDLVTTTDESGQYRLMNVTTGTYKIQVYKVTVVAVIQAGVKSIFLYDQYFTSHKRTCMIFSVIHLYRLKLLIFYSVLLMSASLPPTQPFPPYYPQSMNVSIKIE